MSNLLDNEVGEKKVSVNVEPIDGLHLSDYDFKCVFYTYTNRGVVIAKEDMKKEDDDTYIAILDSEKVRALGKGSVKLRFIGYIPDADFADGYRTEVDDVSNFNLIL